jgi:hypothetical protein
MCTLSVCIANAHIHTCNFLTNNVFTKCIAELLNFVHGYLGDAFVCITHVFNWYDHISMALSSVVLGSFPLLKKELWMNQNGLFGWLYDEMVDWIKTNRFMHKMAIEYLNWIE